MNAYELAKQLEERHAPYEDDAANMLRKQADRIAELEKKPQKYCPSENNKAYEKGFIDGMAKQRESSVDKWVNATALQTKPLSDEEIHELANEHLRTQNQDGHLVVLGMEDFARAIEEAHGIK